MTGNLQDLLRPDVQAFISENLNEDESVLILRNRTILGLPTAQIAEQINGKKKAREKLPLFYRTRGIVYPPQVSLEQSSSEVTAAFKAKFLLSRVNSKDLWGADVTAGFGIDAFFLSRICERLDAIEPSASLLEIAKNNHKILGAHNIVYHQQAAEVFVNSVTTKLDFIFIDPSRRKNARKSFRLTDGEPDVVRMLPDLFKRTGVVLLKAAPLLDLSQGLKDLAGVESVVILSLRNDCKEVLFLCRKDFSGEPQILCVHILADGSSETFSFSMSEEKNSRSIFSDPQAYLYEPNSSILKAGAFKILGQQLALSKIHPHTHLYTSDKLLPDFPGRIFKLDMVNPDPGKIKAWLPEQKANVVTRNYPLTPEQLKKKLKIQDGGDKYVIGFSGVHRKFVVLASRLMKKKL